ncbi:hypothetical protein PAL_GLEAN10006883 [Pteropus alecto]|uniref:Uncharacterized protein n=1 Tax=Pteropus alecto TaxID=9402 RepID=L5L6U9_PTEAL|nr:hypothetical protein PAL_GLEAN10006883 [Pteropus alecto]
MGGEEERASRDEGVAGGVIPRYSRPPPGSCGCATSHSGRDSKCNHVRKQTTSAEEALPQTQGFSFSLMFLETCKRGGSRRKLAKFRGQLAEEMQMAHTQSPGSPAPLTYQKGKYALAGHLYSPTRLAEIQLSRNQAFSRVPVALQYGTAPWRMRCRHPV